MRADQLLVLRGLAASRAQAQRLIAAGLRWQQAGVWKPVLKNGDELPADAVFDGLDATQARYVSRGGLKLEGALRSSGLAVQGLRCLDVGQSTGGFTDCLLQHGAAQVTGVDVGHDQLHERLRADPRVRCLERLNARKLQARDVGRDFALVVGDLSFISQTLVLPALVPLLAPGGHVLMLVKPQFELQPGQVGKGGIVRDGRLYDLVAQRIQKACVDLGLALRGWYDSPIAGGDGNREFFVFAQKEAPHAQSLES
jgi:23S rRNA (cytidine1920-2'-O)/16S rRNA (cytidine1409-2'-O)-methyltransferase